MTRIPRTPPDAGPFAFTEDNQTKARAIIARYPERGRQSALLPLLQLVQEQEGWLSVPAMDGVAALLDLPPVRVYEVASFYTMFNLAPVGRYHLQICTNLPCMLRGSQAIVEACEGELGIRLGETTADGLFTLSEVECLGACVNAPVLSIGDDYYEDLGVEQVLAIIRALKRGERPRPGSQTGRTGSAPVGGPTTLTGGGRP